MTLPRPWNAEELVFVRKWYMDHQGKPLRLVELASILGRPKARVCAVARSIGLTDRNRLSGRKAPKLPKHSTETERRAAIGSATKLRNATQGHPRGMAGKRQNPEVIARASAAAKRWRQESSQEVLTDAKDRALATMRERYGVLSLGSDTRGNPYSRAVYGRRPDLQNQFFRSRWEANYARFLNWLVAKKTIASWEYEAETFWFENIRRGVRSYKPDFKVTELNGAVHFVEVKGWMDAKSKTKLRRMAKYHPSVDLRVVDAKAYRTLTKSISGAIPEWE